MVLWIQVNSSKDNGAPWPYVEKVVVHKRTRPDSIEGLLVSRLSIPGPSKIYRIIDRMTTTDYVSKWKKLGKSFSL